MKTKLLIATTNKGKVREIAKLIEDLPLEVVHLGDPSLPEIPESPEEGKHFEENALGKAIHYGSLSGLPTVAEDAGLEIQALDGWPGVNSARVADTDEERVRLTLEKMQDIDSDNRVGWFISVAAFYDPVRGLAEIFPGMVPGVIIDKPRGENGFGYDPIFYCDEFEKTFAELTTEEKNSISHRGKSFRMLAAWLSRYYAEDEPPEGMGLPFPVKD